ncbi:hypothetical protein [Gluconobacter oxydans]|uniref:hypothetical protein n=1 Tax=Gluconobacter oxydans TaxID=442 RepID=UPI00062C1580|nr:hypothetical protein [Gluconobacter oxydans]
MPPINPSLNGRSFFSLPRNCLPRPLRFLHRVGPIQLRRDEPLRQLFDPGEIILRNVAQSCGPTFKYLTIHTKQAESGRVAV